MYPLSFIATGIRDGATQRPGDGQIIHPQHKQLVEQMIAKAREL